MSTIINNIKENNISRDANQINEILQKIGTSNEDGSKNSIRRIAQEYGYYYSTLKRMYKKYISNSTNGAHGGNNKIFSEQEEKDLFEFIKNVYIDCNVYFDDESLRILAIMKWNSINKLKIENK